MLERLVIVRPSVVIFIAALLVWAAMRVIRAR